MFVDLINQFLRVAARDDQTRTGPERAAESNFEKTTNVCVRPPRSPPLLIIMHGGAASTRRDGTKMKYFWYYIDLLENVNLRIYRLKPIHGFSEVNFTWGISRGRLS